MYQKIFKSLTLIILTIISIQLSFANDMKVASGECALSEKDQKKYSRYGNDPSKYRDLPLECAERKCYQKALLNEFNSLVTEKDAEKFKAKFESEIYPVAAGYITDRIYVSEEIKSPGILVLTYKVSVDTESFKEGLKSIGVSFDVKTRKTVMVLIEEYFTPDYVPSNQGAIKKEVIKTEKLKMMEIDNVEIKSDRQEVVRDDGGSFKANEDVDEEYMLNMEREREKTVREFFPPDLTRSKRDKLHNQMEKT